VEFAYANERVYMGQLLEATGINHPSQEGWHTSWYASPNHDQKDLLRNRYRDLGETTLGNIIDTTTMAVGRMESMRQMYEAQTIGALRGADPKFQEQQESNYRELAGSPDRIADFIGWFAQQARHFDEQKHGILHGVDSSAQRAYRDMSKLGLELGGVSQAGDWENTTRLDDMIRAIPVAAVGSPAISSVDVLEAPEDRRVAFRYEAVPDEYGLIRRRRAVANVHAYNGTELLLFKESLGLLVLSQISSEDRIMIALDPHADNNIFLPVMEKDETGTKKVMGKNNTQAALIAGHIFERAIKERGPNRAVVPLGAHYVMKACFEAQSEELAA
jgi:hypothetical protein